MKNGTYLAGGSLRHMFSKAHHNTELHIKDDEHIADFDMFFATAYAGEVANIKLEELGATVKYRCPKGFLTSYVLDGLKIQTITEKFYLSMVELISTFDINACCIAYDGKNFVTTRKAIRDVRNRVVTLNEVEFPHATFRRMIKYHDKGYKIPQSTIEDYTSRIWEAGAASREINGRFYID